MKRKKQNVFIYTRVSSIGQKYKTGLKRQQNNIESYCKQHNYNIVRSYADIEKGTIYDRQELTKLMNDIKQCKIKIVVIERIDRLSRSLVVGQQIIHTLLSMNVRILSVFENEINNTTPEQTFQHQLFSSLAELQKSLLVNKLKYSRDMIRQTRKCEGQKSYKECQPETLRIIKSLHRKRKGLKRMSSQMIATKLNEMNVTSKKGLPFTKSNVYKIIRNHL